MLEIGLGEPSVPRDLDRSIRVDERASWTMADKGCVKRLQKEYRNITKEPVPGIDAHPSPSNILEWHYVLEGCEGSDYEGGWYHGKVVFPQEYPYKPPAIYMITPSGRFKTNMKLCLTMSDYHPETWNPLWSVASILTGLQSFMLENQATTGSVPASSAERRRLAKESMEFNLKSPMFKKLFPSVIQRAKEKEAKALKTKRQSAVQCPKPGTQQVADVGTNAGWGSSILFVAFLAIIMAVPLTWR